MKKWTTWKTFKTIWFSLVIIFFVWNFTTFQSRGLPDDTFTNTDQLSLTISDDQIEFKPTTAISDLHIIFFQGGLADPKAYAPLCRRIAAKGFTVHLIKMSWRMPKWDYKKVLTLFNPAAGNYIIGGHSQGAKMAAQLVYENPGSFKGLFLLGTSHPRDIDLSELSIPTLKLYAEKDGLASVDEVMENKDRLPAGTRLHMIKGGNHSQFGYLGKLFMDEGAEISRDEQQQETLEEVMRLLEEVKANL